MSDDELLPYCMQGAVRVESGKKGAVACAAFQNLDAENAAFLGILRDKDIEIDRLRGVIAIQTVLPIESCNNPECWCHHWNHLGGEDEC